MTEAFPTPTISIAVSGSIKASNGMVVEIDSQYVVLTQPGARGGRSSERTIKIPLREWDAVANAVLKVRDSVARAREFAAQ